MKSTKRVLLFIDQLGSGGAERQLTYLAIGLKRAGYDVRLVRFYPGEVFYEADLREAGIEAEICLKGRSPLKRPFAVAGLVRDWKPDAVIAYLDGTAMGCCLARMLTKFNLIVSERNTTQNLSIKERIKFILYRVANHVVPNSFSQGEFVKKTFPRLSSKVEVITNMVNLEKFRPASIRPSSQRVLTTARIAPQKNVHNYLRALAILKAEGVKANFDWFGAPSSQEYLDSVLELRTKLGLENFIEFHIGGTKNVAEEYRASTHFCLPSSFEGFANVLCEAMACGLVCTASRVSDNPYILSDDALCFNPDDVADIAAKIKSSLIMNESQQMEAASVNRRRIEELCSSESFVDHYISLI